MAKQINCFTCGKEKLSRNEIGLNQKLINRNIKIFHCMNCLAEHFEISVEYFVERIEEFKDSGCTLFE